MPTPEGVAAEYLTRPSSIDVSGVISRAITLVTENLGLTVAATWVAIVILLLLHLVPLLGWVAGIILWPSLCGGVAMTMVRRLRGESVVVGDLFAPFNNGAMVVQLAIAGVLVSVLISLGMMLLVLPGIYLAVGYTFTLLLVIDKQLEFWPAMEVSRRVVHRHWFSMFFVLLLSAIVAMLGLIAVLVGVVITVPIAFAAQAVAYEELFGARSAASAAA